MGEPRLGPRYELRAYRAVDTRVDRRVNAGQIQGDPGGHWCLCWRTYSEESTRFPGTTSAMAALDEHTNLQSWHQIEMWVTLTLLCRYMSTTQFNYAPQATRSVGVTMSGTWILDYGSCWAPVGNAYPVRVGAPAFCTGCGLTARGFAPTWQVQHCQSTVT